MKPPKLRRISLLIATALIAVTAVASAQQPEAENPAPPAKPRPTILHVTPGGQLVQEPPKPKAPARTNKPRIIAVPGSDAGTSAKAKPERPMKEATSDYSFCNQTSYAVSVAVGIRNGGLWATRGWWIVPAGQCTVVIKGTLTQPVYYSFARSSFAHTGPIRTWGGTQTLCTGKGNFQANSDGSDTCGPGFEAQDFAKVETNGKAAWVTKLTEAIAYKSLDQARIAGLQRLLYDLARFDGPIDGVAGPKFNDALTQARAAFAIPTGADQATTYTRLLAEAAKSQASAGLTFCNRTQDIVWTALATDSQGKKHSMGWWRLQPQQCEKVIKDRLVDQFVYAFASADRTEGVSQSWGGTTQFCTRESSFEIEDATDCAGRGFASTGFLKIDTLGRPGITFEFAPQRDESAQK
ncbi:MAG: DUF1036 domain-containing protein [Micropepsaceae bacterium]